MVAPRPVEETSPTKSNSASRVFSVVTSMASKPFNVPVFVRVKVSALTIPVVVKLSVPRFIAPNPEVILPEFKAPVPVIAVLITSLASTNVVSLSSSKENSNAEIVTPPTVTSLLPSANEFTISESERSIAVVIVPPTPEVTTAKPELIVPVVVLSIVSL